MGTKWEKAHKHPCIDCGKPICHVSTRCTSCSNKLKWKDGTMVNRKILRGVDCPWWKGGRHIDGHGYVMILKPSHPRAHKNNYVPEHILVWEEAHGKPLPKGWVVHHLNGIKADNRPENLVATSRENHTSWTLLHAAQQRIRELEQLHLPIQALP